jgi:hypothetical protein
MSNEQKRTLQDWLNTSAEPKEFEEAVGSIVNG